MNLSNRFYYGWVIVIGAFLCYMGWGVSRYLYPYVLPTIEAELNLTHEPMGIIASTYFFAYTIMTFVWGIIADRIGPRKCMLMGLVIILIGLSCMGFMSSPITGSLSYLLCGAGAAGIAVPVVPLISNWFGRQRRGIAFGLATAGTGVAPAVLGIVVPLILFNYSWRWSWWFGAAFVLVMAITSWFLLVDTPAKRGLSPAGASNGEPSVSPKELGAKSYEQTQFKVPIRDILKRGTVWNLAGIYFIWGIGEMVFVTFAVAYLEEIGWGVRAAAGAYATFGALIMPAPIIWGVAADRITKKYLFIMALALQAIGMLIFLGGSTVGGYVGAGIIGFAFIGIPTVMQAAMADYYEPTIIGTTYGFITLGFAVGAIIAPTVGGILGDRTGTLSTAILLGLGALILAFMLALMLKKPPKR
ncbi:L-lactate transporter [subsurface metagenome]